MGRKDIPTELLSDDMIFHYTKFDTFFNFIFPDKRLRLSSRLNTLDPFEKNIPSESISSGIDDDDEHELQRRIFLKAEEKFFIRPMKETKQVSFCRNKKMSEMMVDIGRDLDKSFADYAGFLKPRMWEQYGDNYKGVCLVFSKGKIIEQNSLKGSECKNVQYLPFSKFIGNSIYLDKKRIIKEKVDEEKVGKDLYQKRFMKKYRFHCKSKVKDYRDEDEFRILKRSEKDVEYLDVKGSLIAVIYDAETIGKGFAKSLRALNDIDVYAINWKTITNVPRIDKQLEEGRA